MSLPGSKNQGQTGEVPAHEAGKHLPLVRFTCPDGHRNGTQKPSGSQARCGQCHELGREVLVTVPARSPFESMEVYRESAKSAPKPRRHQCGACQREVSLPAGTPLDQPRGWLSLSVRVPPDLAPNGKGYRYVGQWCSVACLAASIPGLARAERVARADWAERGDWPAEPPDGQPADPDGMTPFGSSLAALMREAPSRSEVGP